jgi:ribosomal protein L11 methyltransferase
MKTHYVFKLKQGSEVEVAIGELSRYLEDIYEMQDPETEEIQIGGYSDKTIPVEKLHHVALEEKGPVEEIDWQKQWADFAPSFRDGFAHIDLETLGGPILLLKPGAGFGDLSHPTTRLTLALMAPLVKDKVVFDIGCGSGILSIAAVLLGAKKAYGIDIDQDALKHSNENAQVNRVDDRAFFSKKIHPKSVPEDPFVIVMNMIERDQKKAWQSVSALHLKNSLIVASGILTSHRAPYLKLVKSWGWSLIGEKEEEGWSGFIFKSKT